MGPDSKHGRLSGHLRKLGKVLMECVGFNDHKDNDDYAAAPIATRWKNLVLQGEYWAGPHLWSLQPFWAWKNDPGENHDKNHEHLFWHRRKPSQSSSISLWTFAVGHGRRTNGEGGGAERPPALLCQVHYPHHHGHWLHHHIRIIIIIIIIKIIIIFPLQPHQPWPRRIWPRKGLFSRIKWES